MNEKDVLVLVVEDDFLLLTHGEINLALKGLFESQPAEQKGDSPRGHDLHNTCTWSESVARNECFATLDAEARVFGLAVIPNPDARSSFELDDEVFRPGAGGHLDTTHDADHVACGVGCDIADPRLHVL